MAAYFFVLQSGGWSWGHVLGSSDPLYRRATTACLSAIVVMQIANVYLCRSARPSVTMSGLLDNRLIALGIVVEISAILLIDYTPWGQAIFATSAIAPSVWLFVLPFAAAMLLLEEGRKVVVQRFRSW